MLRILDNKKRLKKLGKVGGIGYGYPEEQKTGQLKGCNTEEDKDGFTASFNFHLGTLGKSKGMTL